MATKDDRIKEKRELAIVKSQGTAGEPKVTEANYRIELMLALNYYAREDDKPKRVWLQKYLTDNNLTAELALLVESPDYLINKIGVLARLINRGQYVSPEDIKLITSKFKVIKTYLENKVDNTEEQEKQVTVRNNKHEMLFLDCLNHIDTKIDNRDFDFVSKVYFTIENTPAPVQKRISKYFEALQNELSEIDTDEQLQEGYSHLSSKELKQYKTMIDDIINNKNSPKPKKQKVVKVKSPAQQVAKLTYLKSFSNLEFELISINPEVILKSKELWVYNTENRILSVYKSDTDFLIKGTTITNFDGGLSKSKRLRKPEVFFSQSLAKVAINKAFDELTTVNYIPNGRINNKMILLKAY